MEAIVGKQYKHYRNGEVYTVLAIARHSETLEEFVVYRGEYTSAEFGANPVWARPRTMFEETVADEHGAIVQRFQLLTEQGS